MELEESTPYRRTPRRLAPTPITATIEDTSRMTGLGRTKIYELLAEGKLRSVCVGRRRLVIYESITELLEPTAE